MKPPASCSTRSGAALSSPDALLSLGILVPCNTRELRTREPCPSRTRAFLEGFAPALYPVFVRGQAYLAIRPGNRRQLPISSIKEVKKKNTSPVAGFFLAVQPTPLSRIGFALRSLISGRYEQLCSALGFSTGGLRARFVERRQESIAESHRAVTSKNRAVIFAC